MTGLTLAGLSTDHGHRYTSLVADALEGGVLSRVPGAAYTKLKDASRASHEALWSWQSFYRALSLVNGGRERKTDLFTGLRD